MREGEQRLSAGHLDTKLSEYSNQPVVDCELLIGHYLKEREHMNKIASITGLAIAASTMTASADVLLSIDLSVIDQITISATDGLSAVDAVGSDGTGVYLENFFGVSGSSMNDTLVSGDLASAENPASGTPNLFRGGSGADVGMNIWNWSPDFNVTFTAGSVAFVGSATFDVTSANYADMLAGNTSGNLYFPADDSNDVAGAALLGTWSVVPAPSSLALLGLGGIVAGRRRRA